MNNNLVIVDSLKKAYGGRVILDGISFNINMNEVLAIIGPNGVGKTTTVEIVLGMRKADSGSVKMNITDIKRELGAQLQNTPFFYNLSVEENIRMFCNFYKINAIKETINDMLNLFDLEDVRKANVFNLSGGQKKRLSIALATLHNPRIIFLDEPTADLDPRGRIKIRNIIKRLASENRSVVFTSHDMNEVVQIADRVLFFDNGQIKESGSPKEIVEKYQANTLEEVYLILTENENGGELKNV